MKRLRFVSGFVMGMVVATGSLIAVGSVRAFNPQPDPPGVVGRLEAVINVLQSANNHLQQIADANFDPPAPIKPAMRASLAEISSQCDQTQGLVKQIQSQLVDEPK